MIEKADYITLLYGENLLPFFFFADRDTRRNNFNSISESLKFENEFYFLNPKINSENDRMKRIKIMIENYNDYIHLKKQVQSFYDVNDGLNFSIDEKNTENIKINFYIHTFINRLSKKKVRENVNYETIYETDNWKRKFSEDANTMKVKNKLMTSAYVTYYEVRKFLYENDSEFKHTFEQYVDALHSSIDSLIDEFFPLNEPSKINTPNTYDYFKTTLEKYIDERLPIVVQPEHPEQNPESFPMDKLSIKPDPDSIPKPDSKRKRENHEREYETNNKRKLRKTLHRIARLFGEKFTNINMDPRTKRRYERARVMGGAKAYKKRVVLFEVINCLIRPEKLSSEFKAHGRYELYKDDVLEILKDLLTVNVVVELLGVWTTKNQKKAIELFQNQLQTDEMLKNITIHFIEKNSYDSTVQNILVAHGNISKVHSHIIGANDNTVKILFGLKYKSSMDFFYKKQIQNITNRFIDYQIKKPPKVIILSGYPGSGKSTVSKEFKRMKYAIIDGDLYSPTKMIEETRKLLQKKKSFVIDGTFLNKRSRKVYLDMIRQHKNDYGSKYKVILIQVTTDPFESYVRNVKRSKTSSTILNPKKQSSIPLRVYEDFLKKYQHPSLIEGFDKIEQYPKSTLQDDYLKSLETADMKLSKYLTKKLMEKVSKK